MNISAATVSSINCTVNCNRSNFQTETILQCDTIRSTNVPMTLSLQISTIVAISCHIPTSVFSLIINMLIMIALLHKGLLRTAANLILTSMAFSDFLVGLLVQPCTICLQILDIIGMEACLLRKITAILGSLCVGGSFATAAMFALDRCFAITMPYRYNNGDLYTKYASTIAVTWSSFAMLVILTLGDLISYRSFLDFMQVSALAAFIIMVISYVNIHIAIKAQRRKIAKVSVGVILCAGAANTLTPGMMIPSEEAKASLPVKEVGITSRKSFSRNSLPRRQRATRVTKRVWFADDANSIINIDQDVEVTHPSDSVSTEQLEMEGNHAQDKMPAKHEGSNIESSAARPHNKLITFLREKARANTVAIILVAMIMCYLPSTVVEYLKTELELGPVTLRVLYQWCNFLVMLNSSLNPIIYCLRVQTIRKEVKSVWIKWCTFLRCR
eukprot:Seg299.7 transcript_id=Seg299.7/GoldUCD/mRNA.D3Y31 product="Octopamine receptor" protein_id=Seg299.7/GoldUCD/D3Y31